MLQCPSSGEGKVIWQMATAFYLCFAGFSAQPLYTSSLIATFNVVWTSWPTIGFAVLEQVSLLSPEHQNPRSCI